MKEREYFGNLDVDGNSLLKFILMELRVIWELDSTDSGCCSMAGYCERDNNLSDSILDDNLLTI
jgi:hypothetical protein